jgi:hypothetical protein
MGLLNLTADKVTQIFGFRKHKRLRDRRQLDLLADDN